jgi:putative transposase
VFEDLHTKNMTASAKGTVQTRGKQVRQKTGLKRSMLASAWGKTALYLDDKAQRRGKLFSGKLFIKVPAHHCSQECSACRHTNPDNRQTQAWFVCTCCGHSQNADTYAAKVLARRGVRLLLAGAIEVDKPKKRCSISRKKVDPEGIEPRSMRLLPVDSNACGDHGKPQRPKAAAHRSRKEETPTTTPSGVSWRVLRLLETRASKSKPNQGVVKVRTTTLNQHGEAVQILVGNTSFCAAPTSSNCAT